MRGLPLPPFRNARKSLIYTVEESDPGANPGAGSGVISVG
jgi:hypothetical protein